MLGDGQVVGLVLSGPGHALPAHCCQPHPTLSKVGNLHTPCTSQLISHTLPFPASLPCLPPPTPPPPTTPHDVNNRCATLSQAQDPPRRVGPPPGDTHQRGEWGWRCLELPSSSPRASSCRACVRASGIETIGARGRGAGGEREDGKGRCGGDWQERHSEAAG